MIAVALALISFVPSLVLFGMLTNEVNDRCKESRTNRVAIRETFVEGLSTLGYRYDTETGVVVKAGAPLDYYLTHPEEQREALDRSLRSLERFPAIHCDPWWDL